MWIFLKMANFWKCLLFIYSDFIADFLCFLFRKFRCLQLWSLAILMPFELLGLIWKVSEMVLMCQVGRGIAALWSYILASWKCEYYFVRSDFISTYKKNFFWLWDRMYRPWTVARFPSEEIRKTKVHIIVHLVFEFPNAG